MQFMKKNLEWSMIISNLQVKTHNFEKTLLNPQAPAAQKIADEVIFRRFQGEGVEFFLIGPH